MRKLSSLPHWTQVQAHHLNTAPRWLKMACSGLGITHYASRGKGPNKVIVVWNARYAYEIRANESA